MKKIVLIFALALVFGCSSIRPDGNIMMSIKSGDQVVSINSKSPTPIWVENFRRIELKTETKDGDKVTAMAEYKPDSKNSSNLTKNFFSGLFGFLAGLATR